MKLVRIKNFILSHWIILFTSLLFFLLLLRNPFSTRNLIANLEPFPDSFHYIDSSFSFIKGKGFFIEREGRTITPTAPPLYSLVLSPIFLLIPDARAFYFTNMILAAISFYFFYLIVKKIFPAPITQLLLLFLYSTNILTHWFPTLAMAENLIMPLSMISLYLLLIPSTRKMIALASFLAVSFYATKYAALPLSVAYVFLYGAKLINQAKQRRTTIPAYLISLLFFSLVFLSYEYFAKNPNVVKGLFGIFISVVFPQPAADAAGGKAIGGGAFFGASFIRDNIQAYVNWLIGKPIYVLWKPVTIMPAILAIPSLIGLALSIFDKRFRQLGASILAILFFSIAFLMVFYAHDGRYFIIALPSLVLGLGFIIEILANFAMRYHASTYIRGIAAIILICLFIMSAKQLKFWIMLNLRYSETPWYFISVKNFDSYLHNHKEQFTKEPVVISALPPYLVDFYAKEKFILLPLSAGQEFRTHPQAAWGKYDYSSLIGEYERLLKDGHPLILTKYGLGNEAYPHITFDIVKNHFDTKLLEAGCYDLCNIYQLTLKPQN